MENVFEISGLCDLEISGFRYCSNGRRRMYKKGEVKKQECLSALCRASFVDVYLAYLKSYGHLKIIKCIGMY